MPRRNYRKGERRRAAFLRREAERKLRELTEELRALQAARREADLDTFESNDSAADD